MAAQDKYIDDLCGQPWDGLICPHGIDHSGRLVCSGCLNYVMIGG